MRISEGREDDKALQILAVGRRLNMERNDNEDDAMIYASFLKGVGKDFFGKFVNFRHLLSAYENGLEGKFEENRIISYQ